MTGGQAVAAVGVDVGSTTCKAVAIDAGGRILASAVEPVDPRIEPQVERLLAGVRGSSAGVPVGATGYGRKRVPGARAVTEITCHARGAFARLGRPGLLLDLGGQDTKAIRLGAGGQVLDFAMNDKCAAGTGRFLEVILGRLGVPLAEVAALSAGAGRPVAISSTCTVFAESEVISLVAAGEPLAGIVRGLHRALASRVVALCRLAEGPGEARPPGPRLAPGQPRPAVPSLGAQAPAAEVFASGGVALNQAMVEALRDQLGRRVEVLPEPQLMGALGAALAALPAAGRGA